MDFNDKPPPWPDDYPLSEDEWLRYANARSENAKTVFRRNGYEPVKEYPGVWRLMWPLSRDSNDGR